MMAHRLCWSFSFQLSASMASKRGVSLAPRRVPAVVVPDDMDDDDAPGALLPLFGSQPARGTAAMRSRAKSVVGK